MKRWCIGYGDVKFVCSLLGFAGTAKVATFKSDCGHVFSFQFMKFFDFANCKSGKKKTGWTMMPTIDTKVRAQIIFK